MVSGPSAWLAFGALVVLTAAGLRFYLPLARAVCVRHLGRVDDGWVQWVDAVAALLLVAWFASLGRESLAAEGSRLVDFRDVVTGAALYGAIVLFLAGSMVYRNISLEDALGLGRAGFGRALGHGLLALVAAYPLLLLVQAMVYGASGGQMQPQEVVEFLQHAEAPRDRIAVLVMAVIVAPVAEEFIFRGYLYPVGRKYLGPFFAVAGSSFFFALLHGHLASLPALFTLAVCLALAYEKSGSLLVPMVMHATFNAVSILAILYLV